MTATCQLFFLPSQASMFTHYRSGTLFRGKFSEIILIHPHNNLYIHMYIILKPTPSPLHFPCLISPPAIPGWDDLGKSNMTITRNLGDRRKYRSSRSNSLFVFHVFFFIIYSFIYHITHFTPDPTDSYGIGFQRPRFRLF